MKKIINGLTINYRIRHNKNRDKYILLLHGWGGSLDSFKMVENYLVENGFSTINMDFPGFGFSDVPNKDFTLYGYKDIVLGILQNENIQKVDVISHSFGGRVAILLASETSVVNKLVLVDSAGLKPKFSLKKWFKIKAYKLKKFLNKNLKFKFNLQKYGSEDYRALPNAMKPVFNNVIKLDLTKNLNSISCPTLIVWGQKDKSTPLYMAKKLNKKIKNSGLIVYEDCGHFSYLEKFRDFCITINEFLK